jgi:hypothetical protein
VQPLRRDGGVLVGKGGFDQQLLRAAGQRDRAVDVRRMPAVS